TGNSELEIFSDCARFVIFAEVKKEKMPQMVAAVARSLRDLRNHGLTAEELAAARLLLFREVRSAHDVPETAAIQYGYATVRGEPCPDEIIAIAETSTME